MPKSEYPKHYTMKQNRLIRLQQSKGRCEVCRKPAKLVHHIDLKKSNHALSNLAVLCHKCHGIIHTGFPRKPYKRRDVVLMAAKNSKALARSKYVVRFGYTRNEILAMTRKKFSAKCGEKYLSMSPSKFIKAIKRDAN